VTRTAQRWYETLLAEDLNVTGMISNKKLARAVADQGFGTIRRMLAYKSRRGRDAPDGRPLVPVIENMFPLRVGESQAHPQRPDLRLRRLRAHRGPRHQRGPEPAFPRRQWGGEPKRAPSGGKTRHRRAHRDETRTRTPHRDKTGTATPQGTAAA